MTTLEHVDVLIVGAGLSGIGAACHLQRRCPNHSFAIVEGRDRSGGTWDLFRYPGVRSDSDMYTLGYAFRPWRGKKAIADGAEILQYLRDTASEHGVDKKIRYGHRVKRAAWSSAQSRWTVDIERVDVGAGGDPAGDGSGDGDGSGAGNGSGNGDGSGNAESALQLSCNFLLMCSGYYRYDSGHAPAFPGMAEFGGRVVHPQHWSEDIHWAGKRVVVIGSGATAMTLVPAMAERAAQVTMVQRSPTWVVSRPSVDPLAQRLGGWLPRRLVHTLTRWKQVLLTIYVFNLCRGNPERAKKLLLAGVRAGVGNDADVQAHFTPRYKPWEQRLCLLPDGDLFRAMRAGKVAVVTDQIASFTRKGLKLQSGAELEADLIVTATGITLQTSGGVQLSVDGKAVDAAQALQYKGLMLSDVPNFAATFGYTNASWTLKADLSAEYVCRLLNYMRKRGHAQCMPHNDDPTLATLPWMDFSSGYLQRSLDQFPKQGTRDPWRLHQNYLRDIRLLRFGRIDDGTLRFAAPRAASASAASSAAAAA